MSVVWRIAWRWLARGAGRAVLAASLTVALTATVTVGFVLLNAVTLSDEQIDGATLLGADGSFNYGMLPDEDGANALRLSQLRSAAERRYGSETEVIPGMDATDVTVRRLSEGSAAGGSGITARVFELDAQLLDLDKGFAQLEGQPAISACTASVSKPLAAQLGIAIGDSVELAFSPRPIQVVGIYEFRVSLDSAGVILAPGSWAECVAGSPGAAAVIAFESASISVPAAASQRFAEDFAPAGDTGDGQTENIFPAGVEPSALRSVESGWAPLWVKRPIDFTLPIMALLGVAVAAQMTVRMRKDAQLVGSLQALGFTRRQVTAVIVLGFVIPISIGTLLGFGLGLGIGVWLQSGVARLAGRDMSTNPLPVDAIAWGMASFVGAATVALAMGAWLLARDRSVAANSVRFAERMPIPAGSRLARIIFFTLVLAVAASWVVLPADGVFGLVRGALTCTALLAALPLATEWFVGQSNPKQFTAWLGSRVVRAHRVRTVMIAAVVAFGLATPLALLIGQSTSRAISLAQYQPQIPDGQVIVRTQIPVNESGLATFTAAAGVRPVMQTLAIANGNDSSVQAIPGTTITDDSPVAGVTIVGSRAEAGVILGWEMSDDQWRVVAGGKALWVLDESRPTNIQLVTYDEQGKAEVAGSITAVGVSESVPAIAKIDGGLIMSDEAARNLDLQLVPYQLRFQGAAQNYEAIATAAASLGIGVTDVRLDEGPDFDGPPVSFNVAVLMALALVAAVVFVVVASAGREDRKTTETLISLGMATMPIRNLHLFVAGVAIAAGVGVGIVAALSVFIALNFRSGITGLAIPWSEAAITIVGVLTIGAVAAGAGAFVRRT